MLYGMLKRKETCDNYYLEDYHIKATMLEAIKLSKTFKVKKRENIFHSNVQEIEVVSEVSIKIEPGQIIGLVGINGAGKTTTIKMLSSLLMPTKGKILIDGIDGLKNKNILRGKIGLITGGERNLYWQLTGRENLEYFGALYAIPRKILNERIENYIRIFGLESYIDLPVELYSKGMKQRLQIARGIINDPKYIFLDEPTIGLDVEIMKEVHEFIKRLKKEGKGILLTSHYMAEIEELCDEIYIINKGKIICSGSPKEIVELSEINYKIYINVDKKSYVNVLQKSKNFIEEKLESTLILNVNEITVNLKKEKIPLLIKTLIEYGVAIEEIRIDKPKLEDAIIRITENREGENE